MDNQPRERLCELIAKYGEALCDYPARCEGLLRDLCPHDRREVYVLANALKARIGTDLRNHSDSIPIEMTLARLTKRLEDEQGLSLEMAKWAVESWALALGKISEEQLTKPEQPAAPKPSAALPTVLPSSAPPPVLPPLAVSPASVQRSFSPVRFKAIMRDVVIIAVLMIGAFAVRFFRIYIPFFETIAIVLLLGTIGFAISGYLSVGNRWRHLACVAFGVWLVFLVCIFVIGGATNDWAPWFVYFVPAVFVAVSMALGGAISYIFKRKTA